MTENADQYVAKRRERLMAQEVAMIRRHAGIAEARDRDIDQMERRLMRARQVREKAIQAQINGYRFLMDMFGLTREEVAARVDDNEFIDLPDDDNDDDVED